MLPWTCTTFAEYARAFERLKTNPQTPQMIQTKRICFKNLESLKMFKKIARNMKLFCMQIEEAGLRFQNMYLVCAADLRRAFAFRI